MRPALLRVTCATALLATACAAPVGRHSLIGDPTPIGNEPTLAPTTSVTTTTVPETTTTVGAATTTSAPPSPPRRPYAVGWTSLDLTDPSRATAGRPGRHLPTLVFYPSAGSDPASETPSAPPLSGGWPLVVFAHGYNTTPLTYHDLVHHLASAGFVVAAPSFPLETAGGPLDENDLSNEPGDIKFVITRVLGASADGGLLHQMIDPTRIALAGHSDGGEAVVGEAFLPGVDDPRVGPVIAMAAQGILNGSPLAASPRHALLVVQGTADTINPPARGDRLYAAAPNPKAYLRLLGAGHLPPVADPTPWRPVVEAVAVDWLDAWFGGPNSGGAAGRLGHDGDIPGTSSIQLG